MKALDYSYYVIIAWFQGGEVFFAISIRAFRLRLLNTAQDLGTLRRKSKNRLRQTKFRRVVLLPPKKQTPYFVFIAFR